MSNLIIGETILRLRKEKGITQEELANMVGVSAGAVCKWETGNSVPDIALLAPLARTLSVSLDELLSFSPKLSEDEVLNIKKRLTEVFIQNGYESGEKQCKDFLNEYPNSVCLKLTIAGLISMYSMMSAEESEELYKLRVHYALKLLDEVVESKEIAYVSQALFIIANIQMILENYDESEKALKKIPTTSVDPMTVYPILLQRQGKNHEAKVLCEKMLLSHLNQTTAMLATVANISISLEDYNNAEIYIEAIRKIQSLFDVGLNSGDYSLCNLYIRKKQLESAAKYFKIYVKGLISTAYDYSDNEFFKDIILEVDPQGQKLVRQKMYKSHIYDPSLKILEGLQDYDEAIEILKIALL